MAKKSPIICAKKSPLVLAFGPSKKNRLLSIYSQVPSRCAREVCPAPTVSKEPLWFFSSWVCCRSQISQTTQTGRSQLRSPGLVPPLVSLPLKKMWKMVYMICNVVLYVLIPNLNITVNSIHQAMWFHFLNREVVQICDAPVNWKSVAPESLLSWTQLLGESSLQMG